MRICTKCNSSKPLEDFAWKRVGIRRAYDCKDCHRDYNRQYYIVNKEKEKVRVATFKENRQTEIFELLKQLKTKCSRCDENRPAALQFHHKDSADKEINISKAVNSCWSNERLLSEIIKCEVICANCHMVEHFGHNY